MRRATWILGLALAGAAAHGASCGNDGSGGNGGTSTSTGGAPPAHHVTAVSSSLALTSDDHTLWIVNQDSDSVSVIDVDKRMLVTEIALGDAPPAVDPTTQRFDPRVLPRSIALVDDRKAYVVGETKNKVFVIDTAKHLVLKSIDVPAAPVSVAASPDGSAVYVVSHEAAQITKIDVASDTVTGSLTVSGHPWGASVSPDGGTLFVTHLLLDPGVSVIDTRTLTLKRKTAILEQPPGGDKRVPNGVARGVYSAVPRPDGGELWAPYMLLAVRTPEPALDFQSTVFPTISTFDGNGAMEARRLLFQPPEVPGAEGAYADPVSGPRALAFTPDGKLALLALGQSEDVMVFDVDQGVEVGLVRPLPSTMLEGIVVDHTGKHAYVDGRNTHDVTVLSIDQANDYAPVAVDGAPIDRLSKDPMPATLRHGQRLFYTANSAAFPITQNFWVACATCHIEGGSDAVTWLFTAGPRDTPSNAGGPINTGFLLRQAQRSSVQQYDETIRVEQGGLYHVDQDAQKPDLDAIAAFVNYAIPFPQNPHHAPGAPLGQSEKHGETLFQNLCSGCHTGAYLTDSGSGNPALDFSKPVLLHDIGTCVHGGAFPDRPGKDVVGNARTACDFDTPTLRGIFATPPYFHDGSAATLKDVVDRLPFSSSLPAADKADLVAYLETL